MNDSTINVLDLFQPPAIIDAIIYQATAIESDCWEQRHIEAMKELCEYVRTTYPRQYYKVLVHHQRFNNKQADI
jgi:hypothetical protein